MLSSNKTMDDKDCWNLIESQDLWVIDKLILAKTLGYVCGPAGVAPPKKDKYIIRPCVNFKMMGKGAYISNLGPNSYDIPTGFFWCELFRGRHLSFDYNYGKQVLAVEGFKTSKRLDRFSKWCKITDVFLLPKLLDNIAKRYQWFNVEVIDNKVIEAHFRYNDDFANHNSKTIIPVWKENFYPNACGDRIGFLLK
jgi:hypothetical protein